MLIRLLHGLAKITYEFVLLFYLFPLTKFARYIINFRMSEPLLFTKLYLPPPRPDLVPRPNLLERLNAGLIRKLTLISAPAGFGKTTLVSEWLASCGRPVAWLSLDEGDADPSRFLTYFVAALQKLVLSRCLGSGKEQILGKGSWLSLSPLSRPLLRRS